ncbi:6-phosphogluconolactonase [Candidatus Saccharibacteria bacterium]|nr:6-phosphogluconolactonase [Candidatus Saccharibacteria bacterium]
MQFINTDDRAYGASALRTRLTTELDAKRRVLWLVSGGSNIEISVAVMNELTNEQSKLLSVLLTDERHGVVNHSDSNGAQLLAAGFDHKLATLIPVLVGDRDLETTRRSYDHDAIASFAAAEIVIGQFGIGADGHIAGILPESSAVHSPEFVAAYKTEQYDRLTLTSHAIKRLSVAYVFAYGTDKFVALERLLNETIPYAEQPSQILKELPEVYIFNDQIGESL